MEKDKTDKKKKETVKKKKKQLQAKDRDKYFAFYDDIKSSCQRRVDW